MDTGPSEPERRKGPQDVPIADRRQHAYPVFTLAVAGVAQQLTLNGQESFASQVKRVLSMVIWPGVVCGRFASWIAWKEFMTASKSGRRGFHLGSVVCRT
jgi:hypothetical protein